MEVLPKKKAKEQLKLRDQNDLKRAKALREAISKGEAELNEINERIRNAEREFAKLAPDPRLLQERSNVQAEVAQLRKEREVLLTPVDELLKEAEEKKKFWNDELKKLDIKENELKIERARLKLLNSDLEKSNKKIDERLILSAEKEKKLNVYESSIKENEERLNKEKGEFEYYCTEKNKQYLEQADSLLLRERMVAEKLEANKQERVKLEQKQKEIESKQSDLQAAIKEAKQKGIWHQ